MTRSGGYKPFMIIIYERLGGTGRDRGRGMCACGDEQRSCGEER